MNKLIKLQHAHVTQYSTDGIKGDWLVRQNESSDDLFTLPGHISDKDIFTIMKFAKKFEAIAFNEGVTHRQRETKSVIDSLTGQVKALADKNELLTRKLTKLQMTEDL